MRPTSTPKINAHITLSRLLIFAPFRQPDHGVRNQPSFVIAQGYHLLALIIVNADSACDAELRYTGKVIAPRAGCCTIRILDGVAC